MDEQTFVINYRVAFVAEETFMMTVFLLKAPKMPTNSDQCVLLGILYFEDILYF